MIFFLKNHGCKDVSALFLRASITSTEKFYRLFWLIDRYQLLQSVRTEAIGDDPKGGKEDMRNSCFPKKCKYDSMCSFCKYKASFDGLRKPYCDSEPNKKCTYAESLAPRIKFIAQVYYWICILFSNDIFIILEIKSYWLMDWEFLFWVFSRTSLDKNYFKLIL